jgi:predicted branched-subunit amino acid permease
MSGGWRSFRRGVFASAPFLIVILPFAVLFGVAAAEAGLDLFQVAIFSASVFAGASQFVALQLMQEQAPTLVVLATALAVNLRLVMYSVAMTPWLGQASPGLRALIAYFLVDQSFAAAQAEYEARPQLTLAERVAFFFGSIVLIAPLWFAASVAGAAVGRSIPPDYALDFAVPITFLAIVAPMLRSLPHLVAAGVSILLSLALAWMPWGTGLLVAAGGAMTAGAVTEAALERRRAHAG